MGKPDSAEKNKKTDTVNFNLTPGEKAAVKSAASLRNSPIAVYLRSLILTDLMLYLSHEENLASVNPGLTASFIEDITILYIKLAAMEPLPVDYNRLCCHLSPAIQDLMRIYRAIQPISSAAERIASGQPGSDDGFLEGFKGIITAVDRAQVSIEEFLGIDRVSMSGIFPLHGERNGTVG